MGNNLLGNLLKFVYGLIQMDIKDRDGSKQQQEACDGHEGL